MNSAVHQISAASMQADARRAALRNPPLPAQPTPQELPRRTHVLRLLRRLRPALA